MKPVQVGVDVNQGNADLMKALLANLRGQGGVGLELLASAQAKFPVENFPKATFIKLQQVHPELKSINFDGVVFYVRVEGPNTPKQKWKLQINGETETEMGIDLDSQTFDGGIELDQATLAVIEKTQVNLGL